MEPGNLPPFILITQPDALRTLAERLADEKLIAVDTESNSLYAYREQVCLVQFSTREADYLVDTLALAEQAGSAEQAMAPLRVIFENPHIEKVFHAAEYDLLCLRRDFDFGCTTLFDTMQAARILGRSELGLGSLLESSFGIVLDKRHQRADWGERPLSPSQLDYARLDTHYLIELRNLLHAELDERGLVPLAEEDFRHLCAVRAPENGRSSGERPVDPWRVTGAYDLPPQQAAILQELCEYRDEQARKLNRPLFKVIQDRTLAAIAERMPDSRSELSHIPGMTPHQVRRHGRGLLEAVKRGLQAKPIYPPKSPRPDDHYLARLDALKTWRKKLGQEVGVASDVILPRDLMAEIAAGDPQTIDDLHRMMAGFPWRFEHFGGDILNAVKHG